MDFAILIQARNGSSRLPGKVLTPLQSKTMLEHIVERLGKRFSIDCIYVLTSDCKDDNSIAELCIEKCFNLFRGDLDDVLSRYYQCAKYIGAKNIVRITADCPLIDPSLVEELVNDFQSGQYEYGANCLTYTLPDGLDAEVFTFKALEYAALNASKRSDREHVTPYIRRNTAAEHILDWRYRDPFEGRWTVDYPEDLKLVEFVYNNLYQANPEFDFKDVQRLLIKNPKVAMLNSNYQANEGLKISLAQDCSVEVDKDGCVRRVS